MFAVVVMACVSSENLRGSQKEHVLGVEEYKDASVGCSLSGQSSSAHLSSSSHSLITTLQLLSSQTSQDEVLHRHPPPRRRCPRRTYTCKLTYHSQALITTSLTYIQPGIPSASSARTLLSGLTVAAWTNTGTYDRDLFPHWETYEGACNTR